MASSLELGDSQKNTQSKTKLIIIPYGVFQESEEAGRPTIIENKSQMSSPFQEEEDNEKDMNNSSLGSWDINLESKILLKKNKKEIPLLDGYEV